MIRELSIDRLPEMYERFVLPYFPSDEVKPLASMISMYEEGCYKVLAMMSDEDEESIAGCAFITIHPQAKACLLDYYAIDQKCRGKGYGSRMLQDIMKEGLADLPIMIETELVEKAENEEQRQERIRRNHFYEKNGAVRTELITDIFGVFYSIWILGRKDGYSVAEEMEKCYRYMVPEGMYDANCRIPARVSLQENPALLS